MNQIASYHLIVTIPLQSDVAIVTGRHEYAKKKRRASWCCLITAWASAIVVTLSIGITIAVLIEVDPSAISKL